MPEKHSTLTFLTYDTEALENTFEAACEKIFKSLIGLNSDG